MKIVLNRLPPIVLLGMVALLLPLGLPAQNAQSPADADIANRAATVIIRCIWPGSVTAVGESSVASGNSSCTCVHTGAGSSCSCSSGTATTPPSDLAPTFTIDASSNTPIALVDALKAANSCVDAKARAELAAPGIVPACVPLASGSVNALLYSCNVPGDSI